MYGAVAVASGQTALELLWREQKAGRPIPVVLLDMHLPDMDGVHFAKKIRSDAALANTKLVLITDDKAALDAEDAATLGFAGSIRMAAGPQDLLERLAPWMDPPEPTSRQHAA